MIDPHDLHDLPPYEADEGLAETIHDLSILADDSLPAAGQMVLMRRLAGSPDLARVLDLIERGLDAEEQDVETYVADDADNEEIIATRSGAPPGLPPLDFLLARVRDRDLEDAIMALRAQVDRRSGDRVIVLLADGGDDVARRQLAERIAIALNGAQPSRVLDARQDPFLHDLAQGDHGAITIVDGDLAPALVDQLRTSGARLAAVIAPDRELDAFGRHLDADLVLGLSPAAIHRRSPESRQPAAVDLGRTLGLTTAASDDEPALPPLPTGDELSTTLARVIEQRSAAAPAHAQEGGASVLQVLRRLSLGLETAAVRQTLAAFDQLDVRFGAATAEHRLAWSALYRDVGLTEIAAAVLDRSTEQQGADVRVRHARAHLDILLNHTAQAIGQLRTLPHSVYRAHALARAYRQSRELNAAASMAEAGLRDEPTNLHLLIEAGIIASWQRRVAAAETAFRTAHALAPRAGFVLNAWAHAVALNGDADRAERLFARAIAAEPWNARHPLDAARLATTRGLVNEAETLLRPHLDGAQPLARRATIQLVDTLLDAEPARQQEAVALLAGLEAEAETGTVSGEDRDRIIGVRMHLLTRRGRPDAALGLFRRIRRRDTARFLALAITAKLLSPHQLSSIELDLDALHQTVGGDPITEQVEATLRARYLLARDRPGEARVIVRTALDRDPRRPALINMLADVERHAGAVATAEALYHTALDIDPRNAVTHRALAHLLQTQGRADEAARALRYARLAGLDARDNSPETPSVLD